MDERSKRAQMERKRRIRRKKQRRRGLISALVEVLILAVLAFAFCWNRGLETKISGFFGRFDRPPVKELDVTGVNSSNIVLMDVKSGIVIGDLNGKEQIYPASMTKIMTAIVALEAFSDLDHEITLSENIFYALDGQDATQAGFQPGESVRVRDLVYGVMLPSGAECCLALADEVSGSEEAFVEKMNKKAKSIGMKDTHLLAYMIQSIIVQHMILRCCLSMRYIMILSVKWQKAISILRQLPMYIRMELPITVPCLKICRIHRLPVARFWVERQDILLRQGIVWQALHRFMTGSTFL